MSDIKNWLWGGLAALGGYSLLSLSRLSNLAKEFLIEATPRVHQVNLNGIVIAIDVVFKNPTDATISLSHPDVAVYANQAALTANQPLASSTTQGYVYSIAPNAQTRLKPIYLTVDVNLSNVLRAVDWVKTYLRGEAIHLIGRATTKVNGIRVEKLMPVSVQLNPPVTLKLAAKAYPDGENLRVRLNLLATNAKTTNQSVITRLAVYATEADRAVDAPLWASARQSSTLMANKQSQLVLSDARFLASRLRAYPNLTSLVVEAKVTVGNRVAEQLIRVDLPPRS